MALLDPLPRASLVALIVSVLLLGACTDASIDDEASGSEDRGDPTDAAPSGSAADPMPAPELDPPGERSLDLSWHEECSWLGHDPRASRSRAPELVELYLEMFPEHVEELYTRSARSDDRLPGAYRIDGRGPLLNLRDPGIRFRGNTVRALPKKSFSLRFQDDLPGLGADRVNLNAMYTDPSFVREHLAFRMFAAAGVAAPRTEYVNLHLNGVYEGLYLYVQRVDERLLGEHGLPTDDISLVRDRARHTLGENVSLFSDIELPADDDALVSELEGLLDSRGTPDWDAVADLVTWVHSGEPGEVSREEVTGHLDVDSLIDWYALHVLTGDVDAFTDDYWMYGSGNGGGWQLIPWDKDLTFGSYFVPQHGGVTNHLFHYEWDLYDRATSRNDLLAVAFGVPEIRDALGARLHELMTEHLTLGYVCDELAATVPVIADSAAREADDDAFLLHGANHFAATGDHDLHLGRILDYVQLRYAFVDRQIHPIDGEPDIATVELTEQDVGRSVLFTDAAGWTIARFDVLEVDRPGTVEVTVGPDDRSPDIDRIWRVESDAVARGQLSLYYRNTVAFEDWYLGGDDDLVEPVGRQHRLQIVEVADDEPDPLPSVANPYSNRVTGEVELGDDVAFVLVADQERS